MTKVHKDRTV